MHEIGGFMAIEADAVARAMRKAGQMIPRTPALAFIVLAHRVVDGSDWNIDFGRRQRKFLAAFDGIPHFALPGIRLTKYPCSRDIGLVAMHRAAAVHENYRAFSYFLRLHRAMRISGGLIEQHQREFGRAS